MTERQAAPLGWIEAIERGEADAAAGRLVSSDLVLAELRELAARLRADQDAPAEPLVERHAR